MSSAFRRWVGTLLFKVNSNRKRRSARRSVERTFFGEALEPRHMLTGPTVFHLPGDSGTVTLSITDRAIMASGRDVDLFLIRVDDTNGTIDGVLPGTPGQNGYLNKAIGLSTGYKWDATTADSISNVPAGAYLTYYLRVDVEDNPYSSPDYQYFFPFPSMMEDGRVSSNCYGLPDSDGRSLVVDCQMHDASSPPIQKFESLAFMFATSNAPSTPRVAIRAMSPWTAEGFDFTEFRVYRAGGTMNQSLTVNFDSFDGDGYAIQDDDSEPEDADYLLEDSTPDPPDPLDSSVTIPATKSWKQMTVNAYIDDRYEAIETILLTLQHTSPPTYEIVGRGYDMMEVEDELYGTYEPKWCYCICLCEVGEAALSHNYGGEERVDIVTPHGPPNQGPDKDLPNFLNQKSMWTPHLVLNVHDILEPANFPRYIKLETTIKDSDGNDVIFETEEPFTDEAFFYDTSGVNPGDAVVYSIPIDVGALPDGRYFWDVEVYYNTDGENYSTTPDRVFRGHQNIVNRDESIYGRGWWLSDLDYLVIQSADSDNDRPPGVLFVRGTGETVWFDKIVNGSTVTYKREAGDQNFSTLTRTEGAGTHTYTLRMRDGTTLVFNGVAAGDDPEEGEASVIAYVKTQTDSKGNRTTYGYDEESGKVETITTGRSTMSFAYYDGTDLENGELDGYLAQTTLPDNRHINHKYVQPVTGVNLLAQIEYPDPGHDQPAPVLEFVYFDTQEEDEVRHHALKEIHSIDGDTETVVEATSITYVDGTLQIKEVEGPTGSPEELKPFRVDGLADTTAIVPVKTIAQQEGSHEDEAGHETTMVVDRFGMPLRTTDAEGRTTTYRRNVQGQVTQMITPDPVTLTPDGPNAVITSYEYTTLAADGVERMVKKITRKTVATAADESQWRVETWEYDDGDPETDPEEDPHKIFALPSKHVDELGRTMLYVVDADGNVTQVTNVVGNIDSPQNSETDDLVSTYEYTPPPTYVGDELTTLPGGLLLEAIEPAPATGISELTTVTTIYDYYDVAEQDPSSKNGLLKSITYAFGTADEADVSFEYDDRGNVTKVTDELDRITEFTYDNLDRLHTIEPPDPDGAGGPLDPVVTTYIYDSLSRVKTITRKADTETLDVTSYDYDYDAQNHWEVVTVTAPNPADGTATGPKTVYRYDGAGNLVEVISPNPATGEALNAQNAVVGLLTKLQYDALNRLMRTVLPDPDDFGATNGSQTSPIVSQLFDSLGRMSATIGASRPVNQSPTPQEDTTASAPTIYVGEDMPTAFEGVAETIVDLVATFNISDDRDPVSSLRFVVEGNNNPSLLESLQLLADQPGKLKLRFAANQTGTAAIVMHVVDMDGMASAQLTLNVTVEVSLPGDDEYQLNDTDTSSNVQERSQVVANGDGGFLAVWKDWGSSTTNYDIYARRFDASGEPLDDNDVLVGQSNVRDDYPHVVVNSQGEYYVSWAHEQTTGQTGWAVWLQKLGMTEDDCNPECDPEFVPVFDRLWSSEVMVNKYDIGDQWEADLAAYDDETMQGGVIAVWYGANSSSLDPYGVFVTRFDADGTRVPYGTVDELVVNEFTANDQTRPWIAGHSDGYVVVWQTRINNNNEIFLRHLDATGVPIGHELRVNVTTDYEQTFPVNADGDFVVVWRSSVSGSATDKKIMARLFSADGTPAGDEFVVGQTYTDLYEYSSVVATADGGFVVAYDGKPSSTNDSDIWIRRYDALGQARGNAELVMENTTYIDYDQRDPSIAQLSDGRLIVAYSGKFTSTSSDYTEIVGRFFPAEPDPNAPSGPLRVLSIDPEQNVHGPVKQILVTFNRPIDENTLANKILISLADATQTSLGFSVELASKTQAIVTLEEPLTLAGEYLVQVLPDVATPSPVQELDQNGNGTGGEESDRYYGLFHVARSVGNKPVKVATQDVEIEIESAEDAHYFHVVDLGPYFADPDDPDAELTYEIVCDTECDDVALRVIDHFSFAHNEPTKLVITLVPGENTSGTPAEFHIRAKDPGGWASDPLRFELTVSGSLPIGSSSEPFRVAAAGPDQVVRGAFDRLLVTFNKPILYVGDLADDYFVAIARLDEDGEVDEQIDLSTNLDALQVAAHQYLITFDKQTTEAQYKLTLNANLASNEFSGDTLGVEFETTFLLSTAPMTRSVFDEFNRLVQSIDAEGNITKIDYFCDAANSGCEAPPTITDDVLEDLVNWEVVVTTAVMDSSTSADDRVSYAFFNDLGQLIETWLPTVDVILDAEGDLETVIPVVRRQYDAAGNPQFQTETYREESGDLPATPLYSATTEWVYDARNRVTEILPPDPLTGEPSDDLKTVYDYDLAGQLKTVTYFAGDDNVTRQAGYDYDQLGRMIRMASGDPVTGEISRDSQTGELEGDFVTTYEYYAAGNLKKVTQPDPDDSGPLEVTTEYAYDHLYRLIQVTEADPDGPTSGQTGTLPAPVTQYFFDLAGRMVREINPIGAHTDFLYDNLGRMIELREADPNPSGDGEATAGGAQNDPLTIPDRDASGPATKFSYDPNGALLQTVDALGRVTQTAYDRLYRPVAAINALGGVVSSTFNAAGELTKSIDELGRVTTLAYNNLGLVTDVYQPDPDGPTTTIGSNSYNAQTAPHTRQRYDAGGRAVRLYDARAMVNTQEEDQYYTEQVFDRLGRLTQILQPNPDTGVTRDAEGDPAGPFTQFFFDSASQLVRTIDPVGAHTDRVYDKLGRLVEFRQADPDSGAATVSSGNPATNPPESLHLRDPAGPFTVYVYDNLSRLIQRTDPDPDGSAPAPITEMRYDALGRQIELRRPNPVTGLASDENDDPAGPYVAYAYDARSRLTTVTEGLIGIDARVTTHDYDFLDREIAVTDSLEQTTLMGYDAVGNMTSVTDALENATFHSYDALNRRVSALDAREGLTQFGYDPVGNMVSLVDPTLNDTHFVVDRLDRQIAEIDPLGQARTFGYDENGNITRQVDRRGMERRFGYDYLDRLSTEEWMDGETVVREMTLGYDLAGRMTTAEDPAADYLYQYDYLGRRTMDAQWLDGLAPAVSFSQQYDALGRRTQVAATVAGTADSLTKWQYDALSRMTQVTQEGQSGGWAVAEKRVDFTWTAFSEPEAVARYKDLDGGETNLAVLSTYYFNPLFGQLDMLTHETWEDGTIAEYELQYDDRHQLIQQNTWFYSGPTDDIDYTYDATGQLIRADHTEQADESHVFDLSGNKTDGEFTVGAANRITDDGTYEYQYDEEGNRTYKILKTDESQYTEYEWDHRGRLVGIRKYNDCVLISDVEYVYDVFDRRIGKIVDGDGEASGVATKTGYVYDGDQIVLAFSADGYDPVYVLYLRNRYVYGPAIDQILADEQVTHPSSAGNPLWPTADHQGSVREILDNSGDVVNHIDYNSFGLITDETNPSIKHIYAWTGRERDYESDIQFNRARYYDAAILQWLSEDPIRFRAGDYNVRRYAGNGPTNATDPTGRAIMVPPQKSIDQIFAEEEAEGHRKQLERWELEAKAREWTPEAVAERQRAIDEQVAKDRARFEQSQKEYWAEKDILERLGGDLSHVPAGVMQGIQEEYPGLVEALVVHPDTSLGALLMEKITKVIVSIPGESGQTAYTFRWVAPWFDCPYWELESKTTETTPGETAQAIFDEELQILQDKTTLANYHSYAMMSMVGVHAAWEGIAMWVSRLAAGTGGGATSRLAPELGTKLDYLFGQATGTAHNIQRSQQMLAQLERIGLCDTAASRAYVQQHLEGVLNSAANIARTQANGTVVRESLLMGPRGGLKVESIWDGVKLITAKLFGGGG